MEPLPGVLIVVAMFAYVFWILWSARGPDPDAVTRLTNEPLPPETVAYRRTRHVLTILGVSGGFAVLFSALAIDTVDDVPAFIIFMPLALLAAGAFVWSLPLLRDTRWSPMRRPVLSMSTEGITLTGQWSVRWTEVEAIRFERVSARYWGRWYMVLRVRQRERFPGNSWIAEASVVASVQKKVDDSTLVIEISSTTLPEWGYQLLAKRYWCAAHGRRYVPARAGFPISGDVSVDDEALKKQ